MKRNFTVKYVIYVLSAVLLFTSCASKKKTVKGTGGGIENIDKAKHDRELFRKVNSNAVRLEELSSKVKFTIQSGSKSMSVAGHLEMKSDSYIRIRLTPLGLFEAAMIEFTTDYVLVLDRMHKEYIKADYSQVPFLQSGGIDFYALQSLFRNTLFLPGTKHVEDIYYKQFAFAGSSGSSIMSLQKGGLDYRWYVDRATGRINSSEYTYRTDGTASQLRCRYSEFSNVQGKMYPHKLSLCFTTSISRKINNLELFVSAKKFKAEQKGNGEKTRIPTKYKEQDAKEMLNKIFNVE